MIEKTLIFIKPDAVKNRHVGEILARFEAAELEITGLAYRQLTAESAAKHYRDHVDKPFYPDLAAFITSGPVIIAVLSGESAVKRVRALCGDTNPQAAEPGTIRSDYGTSMTENAIHASDSIDSAAREIHLLYDGH